MNDRLEKNNYPSTRFRYLALSAAIMVFVLLVVGGIVRVTGSGGACPDWPTCFGQWTPPMGQNASIDYLHRFATFLVSPLIIAVALVAWLRYRFDRWISYPALASAILLAIQVILGAQVSVQNPVNGRTWISVVHLGLSLLIQAAILIVTVIAFYRERQPLPANRLLFKTRFARFSLFSLGMMFLLLISGAVVAGTNPSACSGWPLCVPYDVVGWIGLVHRFLVALTAGALVMLLWQAWRTQRSSAPILVATTAAVVLFYAQALLGAQLVNDFPAYLVGLHEATAVAVWGAMVIQTAAVGLAARTSEEEQADRAAIIGRKGLLGDLLMLTKPIVVALLLVTTFAGMVIGARSWPPFWIVFWTLVGGFMAAGGSGAINQYIDRYDDGKMQRTQKRPIPSGRLTPAEGLAFGVGISLASFYLMVAMVNFLAALLTLAGIIYYVLLYSIFLKKATVQNIVIGGGAGAIPPLVGWAAATGHLNVPSLFLFAIVFMWTPPHFWALSIVRRKDYARAGVPMLPVIRGEKETRGQILIYTIELVALTLLLPLFGLGSSIYLVGAVILGIWLLSAAWRVYRQGGNKVAWKMYRYSSMYLAFLFVVLMIDRLL